MLESKFSLAGVAGICLPQYSMSIARNHLQYEHCLEYRTMRGGHEQQVLVLPFPMTDHQQSQLSRRPVLLAQLFLCFRKDKPSFLWNHTSTLHCMTECKYTAPINSGRKQQVNIFLNEILKCCHPYFLKNACWGILKF